MATQKFQHPVGRLRQKVREILNLSKGYYLTEAAIRSFVNELLEPDAPLSDIQLALEWNLSEGYVSARDNKEIELKEWCITKEGIAHENT